jgi:hypothetical protein
MQLAIHGTDQSKLFPVMVLLQYARLPYASHCAILGCFAQIRTASDGRMVGNPEVIQDWPPKLTQYHKLS